MEMFGVVAGAGTAGTKSALAAVWKPFLFLIVVAMATITLQTYHFYHYHYTKTEAYEDHVRYKRFLRVQNAVVALSEAQKLESQDCPCDATTVSDSAETDPALLTLFTSMKDSPDREEIHNNTLYNWAALAPKVLPLLYADDNNSQLAMQAKDLGWQLRSVPEANQGIPVFKSLFKDAIDSFDTPYYAFANADILFDGSLVKTLEALHRMHVINEDFKWTGSPKSIHENMTYKEYENRNATGGFLLIGRRTNINLTDISDVSNPAQLQEIAAESGELFITNAEDYFITTAQGIPWHHVPNFVIGRPGYDNWMVVKALDWKLTTVDASDAILAVHQTGVDGNMAGWSTADDTLCINRNLAGNFDYRPGHTKCCPWLAQHDITGQIRVFKREKVSRDCLRIGQPKKKKKKCI